MLLLKLFCQFIVIIILMKENAVNIIGSQLYFDDGYAKNYDKVSYLLKDPDLHFDSN